MSFDDEVRSIAKKYYIPDGGFAGSADLGHDKFVEEMRAYAINKRKNMYIVIAIIVSAIALGILLVYVFHTDEKKIVAILGGVFAFLGFCVHRLIEVVNNMGDADLLAKLITYADEATKQSIIKVIVERI